MRWQQDLSQNHFGITPLKAPLFMAAAGDNTEVRILRNLFNSTDGAEAI